MNGVRRVAAHRVYDAVAARMYAFCLVERLEDGRVVLSPLREEVQSVEWLPGLIVLSATPVEIRPEEGATGFLARISSGQGKTGEGNGFPLRGYWVTPFRVSDMAFLPQTRMVSLW